MTGALASHPASATGSILYAAPTAVGTGSCIDPTDACTLGSALGLAAPNTTIELVTAGVEGQTNTYYQGGFTLSTAGTTASTPVTIEPAPGVAGPILDGGSTNPVLTVSVNAFVTLDGLIVQHGSGSFGGGLVNDDGGSVSVANCIFSGNVSSEEGGAIDNADVGGGSGTGSLTVSGSTFTGNSTRLDGGAIDNGEGGTGSLSVSGSTFTHNTAYDGGAVDNGDQGGNGTATIGASVFSDNNGTFGGALGNGSGFGGSGTLTVSDTTFSGNVAAGYGGAFDNGVASGTGTAVVQRSTFSKNTSAFFGGAIDNGDVSGTGTLTVSSSTFAGNTSPSAGAIDNGENSGTGHVTLGAGIIDSSCVRGSTPSTWTDQGYNVDADATCAIGAAGDATAAGLPQLLGTLSDNGGQTPTIPLAAANPGVARIPLTGTSFCPVAGDQRGVPNPANQPCDVGAVQLAGQGITITSTPPSPAAVGDTYRPTATATSSLPVTLAVTAPSGPVCSMTNGVVTFNAPGTCVVQADQAGNQNWLAAPSVTQQVTVGAPSPSGGTCLTTAHGLAGYWICGPQGAVSAFGGALSWGSMAGRVLNQPVVGMASTPDGRGYWLAAADGGVFAFGDAVYDGSMAGRPLNAAVVAIAATPDGGGYWLVGGDGGVFAFGDAGYDGSMAGQTLNQPVVGMTATPDGSGYWLVAADGGLFSFGNAGFHGSLGSLVLNRPIVGVVSTPDGLGYWFVAADGGVFAEGDAGYFGSTGGSPVLVPVIGLIVEGNGDAYLIVNALGGALSFG